MLRKIFTAILLIHFSLLCYSENTDSFDSEIITDWEKAVITLKISTDINQNLSSLPQEKLKSEKRADRMLSDIFIEKSASIYFNRYQSLKDYIINETNLLSESSQDLFHHKKNYSVLSKDFKTLNLEYQFRLFPDISSKLLKHEYPVEVPKTITWTSTDDFSGIVIYAKGEIPSHGENKKEKLKPALFPRIFDEDMNLILDKEMLSPETINLKGPAAYSDKSDLNMFTERIGLTPFKTSAVEVFGDYHTDIIISTEAAKKILYNKNNRDLIKDGKVLIICDL